MVYSESILRNNVTDTDIELPFAAQYAFVMGDAIPQISKRLVNRVAMRLEAVR